MRMIKCIFLMLSMSFISNLLRAQDIESYVKQHTVRIATHQPDSTNFTDLDAIGKAVGDARIVFMGEQDHGDAPSFYAKSRMIKYLHEQKGFNVLAFESDFFALNQGWDQLPKSKTMLDNFLVSNIFPIWSVCDACDNLLYNFIPQSFATATPMQVTGFDNQMVLSYSYKKLSASLDSVLRSYDLSITHDPNYRTEVIALIDSLKLYKMKDTSQYSKQLAYLYTIKQQLAQKLPADNFWMMVVDNLVSENAQYRNAKEWIESGNYRDEQMAKNILWLATKKYPNEKIIIWAHNAHISKYAGHYNQKFIDRSKHMGSVFDDIKGNIKTYTIGFNSYQGTTARLTTNKEYTVEKPKKNSFENWVAPSCNFAFVDFTKYNEQHTDATYFDMKGLYHQNRKAAWTKIYDGIFFVRDMYPCKLIPKYAQKKL